VCHMSVVDFFIRQVEVEEFVGKRVLEVGSKYINGSVRPFMEKWTHPAEYIGVDIDPGKFVDRIVPAEELTANFGSAAFDCIISTELLEHVKNWRLVVNNLKEILKPGGFLYLSTRSVGFQHHEYPHDYWRYNVEDMQRIFQDFRILTLEKDEEVPGILLKARKPIEWKPIDLTNMQLYSMVLGTKTELVPQYSDMPLGRKARVFALRCLRTISASVSSVLKLE